jgi:hypothetical protein
MRKPIRFLISMMLSSLALTAQQPATFQDPLLDQFVGKWVLAGTVAGAVTTHNVDVAWVLGHQYVRIEEVSREKDAKGRPQYEAIVFIGWDQPTDQYSCLWLDNTGGGGLVGQAIGHAKRDRDKIAFLFKGADGSSFYNTFIYEKGADSWKWLMDNEEKGKLQPFARVKLTRSLK